jgi:N-acetylglucosaminyldiphosphoundecaprenol N-acetyl-beta-D-mannosaminyltransferase
METVRIQDIPVAKIRWPDLLRAVNRSIENATALTIGYVNVHVVNLAARDDDLKIFLQNLDICYCDGRGIQWAASLQGESLPERMTGADWIYRLCEEAAEKGWRIAWIGGEYGVTSKAQRRLSERYPKLTIVHTEHGFHSMDDHSVISRINAASPDLLLVGMGSPIQEAWVARHRDAIECSVVWCLGATADLVSGKQNRGPKWLTERHEWLARLIIEPRRLAKRYIIGNPVFFLRQLRKRNPDG